MIEYLVAVCLVLGAFLTCIASIGMLRLPDLYCRMSATTKAATFGVGFILLGAALHFLELAISLRAAATLLFLFLTAPIAAHVLARAAYLNGVSLWEGSIRDELAGRYDKKTSKLSSGARARRERRLGNL